VDVALVVDVVVVIVLVVVDVALVVDVVVVTVVVDPVVVVESVVVENVVVEVSVVVVVVQPPAYDAALPSQAPHLRSVEGVASLVMYSPGKQVVSGVHSLSCKPPTGGADSHSPSAHGSDVLQTVLCVAVPFFMTNSWWSHSVMGEHSTKMWLCSDRNVCCGHCAQVLLLASRYSPAVHSLKVVVVTVVTVVVVVVGHASVRN
jgi:hypothetical protein